MTKDMTNHGTHGGFAMRTRYANIETVFSDDLQYIAALHHLVAIVAIPVEHDMRRRNGRCEYYQLHLFVQQGNIICEMDHRTFPGQLLGEGRFRFVVAAYFHASRQEEPRNGTHANATDADEVDAFYVFKR